MKLSRLRTTRAGVLTSGVALACLAGASLPLQAKTLTAGAGQEFKTPSAAIAAAHNGDTVHVMPGQYFDCATVGQNNLTIEGDGAASIMTDKTCGGKAILVIDGTDVTIRNMTLQRARVPDGNGAGIRAEGGNLTVDGVHFINNQDGILAADLPDATMRIIGSEFVRNGSCQNGGGCAHAVYVGALKLLHVEGTRLFDTREGHYIKSRALRTEIVNSSIEDGPDGTSSYLVDIPSGGSLVIEGSTMEKGPNCTNHGTAVVIGEEGVSQPTDEILLKDNKFTNDLSVPTTLLRNLTATEAQLIGNKLTGKVRPLEGDGSTHS